MIVHQVMMTMMMMMKAMSETLSEDALTHLSILGPGWLTRPQLDRLLASHRALRTERDALKAELAAAKATIRDFRNVE